MLDELLGIVNVPSGVWIDEQGVIVRPPEPAFPWRARQPSEELMAQLPALMLEQLSEAQKIKIDPESYLAALRDWVQHGEQSRYALSPDEVATRSGPRTNSIRKLPLASSSGSTSSGRATLPTRPAGSGRPTACNRITGPTSARPGRSPTRCRDQRSSTTQTGSPT